MIPPGAPFSDGLDVSVRARPRGGDLARVENDGGARSLDIYHTPFPTGPFDGSENTCRVEDLIYRPGVRVVSCK